MPTIRFVLLSAVFSCLPSIGMAGQPWIRHVIDDSLRGADGVKLFDANSDGLSDIVTGWEESGTARAYFHPGHAKSTLPWPAVTIGEAPNVEDVVWLPVKAHVAALSCCEGPEQSLRLHFAHQGANLLRQQSWKTMKIKCSEGITKWMFAEPLRKTHDSIDVVVGSKAPNGMIGVLNLPSDLERARDASKWTHLVDASWIMSLELLDVDWDGDTDIVYTDRKGDASGLYWLENQGEHWEVHLIGAQGREVMFVSIRSDPVQRRHVIWVPAKSHEVFRFESSAPRLGIHGHIPEWSKTSFIVDDADTIGRAKAIAAGDLDGDGQDELVFSCESAVPPKRGVVYLKQQGDSGWQTLELSGPDGIKFDLIELTDLDGDNDLDVLVCEERHANTGLGVVWYENPLR